MVHSVVYTTSENSTLSLSYDKAELTRSIFCPLEDMGISILRLLLSPSVYHSSKYFDISLIF